MPLKPKSVLCLAVLLWICVFSSMNVAYANSGYYSYSVTKKIWIWIPWVHPYAWRPSSGSIAVTISAVGFPSEYSTRILVDSGAAGQVNGGGMVKFEVRQTETHTFEVETYVAGSAGVRYYCPANSWSSEKEEQQPSYYPYWWWWYYPWTYTYYPTTTTQSEKAHTFSYLPEYQLTVESRHGGTAGLSKWYAKDSVVSLSAPSMVQISDAKRDVFKSWDIDGNSVESPSTVVAMNAPHTAKAVYKTQHLLRVNSEHGDPTGSGWYDENSIARISVQRSTPMEGLLGALGATYDFAGWSDAESNSPVSTVSMNDSKVVTARWNANYLMPLAILAIIVVLSLLVYRRFLRAPGGAPSGTSQAGKLDEILGILRPTRRATTRKSTTEPAQTAKLDEILGYLKKNEERMASLEERMSELEKE